MLRRTLKTAWFNRSRYALTLVAIVCAVAFVMTTLGLVSSIDGKGETIALAHPQLGAVVEGEVVSTQPTGPGTSGIPVRAPIAMATTASIRDSGLNVLEVRETYGRVISTDGTAGGKEFADDNVVTNWEDSTLNPFEIATGAAPATTGEALLDVATATAEGLSIGDDFQVLGRTGMQSFELSGTATFGVFDSAPDQSILLVRTGHELLQTNPPVRILVDDSADDVVAQLSALVQDGSQVSSAADWFEAETERVDSRLGFFSRFLTLFAIIAIVVGAVIVANTFNVSAAQRSQELALQRLVGTSRNQLVQQLAIEALLLGAVGTIIGLPIGQLGAQGLNWLLTASGMPSLGLRPQVSAFAVIAAVTVGLGVTVLTALRPAFKAAAVPPIEALRSSEIEPPSVEHRRNALGYLLTFAGGISLVFGAVERDTWIAGLGVGGTLLGIFLLGPQITRFAARVLRPILNSAGPPGRIAAHNISRNAVRTSSAATALLIGVALIVFFTSTATTATEFAVGGGVDAIGSEAVVRRIGAVPEPSISDFVIDDITTNNPQAETSAVYTTFAPANDFLTTVGAVGGPDLQLLYEPDIIEGRITGNVARGEAAISADLAGNIDVGLNDAVTVTLPARSLELTISAIFESSFPGFDGSDLLLHPEEFREAGGPESATYLLVDGVSTSDLNDQLGSIPTLEALGQKDFLDTITSGINTFLGLIYALLAVSVIISLIGIANTATLAISERSGELASIRAAGSTRLQVFTSLVVEFSMIALVGVTLGVALGAGASISLTRALADGIDMPTIPLASIGVLSAAACLVGSAASWWPAAKASRVPILDSIRGT